MEENSDSFKTYVYRGLDAMLKFSAKAGDSLRVASNNAIEKLDAFQLERKRDLLFSRLGKTTHTILVSGELVSSTDDRVSVIIEEISLISAELERRFAVQGRR